MGLFQQAAQLHTLQNAKSPERPSGLLSRLNRIAPCPAADSVSGLLDQIALACPVSLYALLIESSGCWQIASSSGFDLTTTRRFVPDSIFFTSNIPCGWSSVEKKELTNWQNFFSTHDFDSLRGFSVFRFTESDTALLFADSVRDPENYTLDTKKIDRILESSKSMLSQTLPLLKTACSAQAVNRQPLRVKTMVEESVQRNLHASMGLIDCSDVFPQSVTDREALELERFHDFARVVNAHLGPGNIAVVHDSRRIAVSVFSTGRLDMTMYFHQMEKILVRLYGQDIVSSLRFESRGYSDFALEILEFLYSC